MTECMWRVEKGKLVPHDPAAQEHMAGLTEGAEVFTSVPFRRRNPRFHRLMMKMLHETVEATSPQFTDVEHLMDWLKIKTGMVQEVVAYPGKVYLRMQSVSFAAMSETRFRRVAERWRYIIQTEFGFDPGELLDEKRDAA